MRDGQVFGLFTLLLLLLLNEVVVKMFRMKANSKVVANRNIQT